MMLQRKRAWGVFSAFALACLLMAPVRAEQGDPPGPPPPPPAPGGKGVVGKISAVSSGSITVSLREGGTMTFTISSTATITLDGQTVTAGSLAAGQFAVVGSTDGINTTAIDAHTKRPPPPGGPPPGQGPPPGGPPPDGEGPPPPDGLGPPPDGQGPPPDGPPPGP